jgi:hypothetical protein
MNGHLEIVQFLFQNKAIINLKSKVGSTALIFGIIFNLYLYLNLNYLSWHARQSIAIICFKARIARFEIFNIKQLIKKKNLGTWSGFIL